MYGVGMVVRWLGLCYGVKNMLVWFVRLFVLVCMKNGWNDDDGRMLSFW